MRNQNYLLVRRADESENVLEGEPDYADCLGHCKKGVVLARWDNDNIDSHDDDNDKVNRCLARYSPRATNTNRPANRAPNKPAWPGPN